jgi:aromatic ring-opening dioxygenase catalytic subunit (LigB family)
VCDLLKARNIDCAKDEQRGLDHGTFVPLSVAFPAANVPVVQLSILNSYNPARHIALGGALAPLADENVLILASGYTYHNMGGFGVALGGGRKDSFAERIRTASAAFDEWLVDTMTDTKLTVQEREDRLRAWTNAPHARDVQPQEDHLVPLFVAAGAAGLLPATHSWSDVMAGVIKTSAFEWQ